MPQHAHHFEPQIAAIYDHLYANADFKTPKSIAREVSKVLHTGIFAERHINPLLPAFSFAWQEKRQLSAAVSTEIASAAKSIRATYELMKRNTGLYPAKERIALSDFDLIYSCLKLDGIRLSSEDRDIIGDAVELFRSYWSKSHGGQFFTDSRVTRLAITLLQFDPFKGDTLADICAGSGGFLLAAISHVQNLAAHRSLGAGKLNEAIASSLYGQEVDPEVQEFGNAALSARLGTELKVIARGNSLTKLNPPAQASSARAPFACVVTNPPFGTKITVKDPGILRLFEVSRIGRDLDDMRACAPDTLFLERNLAILKEGGRLAIVLPYQILSGPQTEPLRRWLFSKATINAVIDLPADTFQPYTGTKASLVLLTKALNGENSPENPRVFMACPKWIGHDRRGNPIYEKAPDGSETDKILTDIPLVENAYEAFLRGDDPAQIYDAAFSITLDKLLHARERRFDARYHKPAAGASIYGASIGHRKNAVPLKAIVSKIFYPGRFKRFYVAEGGNAIPFLGGTNISQLLIVTDKWLGPENPHLNQLIVKQGWLLVTRSGSTGIVSSVPEEWDGFAISEHVIRIVPDTAKVPGQYLHAFLRTKHAQDYIRRGVYGSVIDEISPEYLGEMPVPIPRNASILKEITASVNGAEAARQKAITGYINATRKLDELITNGRL